MSAWEELNTCVWCEEEFDDDGDCACICPDHGGIWEECRCDDGVALDPTEGGAR